MILIDFLFSGFKWYRQLIGGKWSHIQSKVRNEQVEAWMRTLILNQSKIEDGTARIIKTESY